MDYFEETTTIKRELDCETNYGHHCPEDLSTHVLRKVESISGKVPDSEKTEQPSSCGENMDLMSEDKMFYNNKMVYKKDFTSGAVFTHGKYSETRTSEQDVSVDSIFCSESTAPVYEIKNGYVVKIHEIGLDNKVLMSENTNAIDVSYRLVSNIQNKKVQAGEKPYRCDICGADFTQFISLKRHQRIHTGEMHLQCDVCGLGFTKSGNLKTHKQLHSRDKPYKCNICSLGFTGHNYLKAHKRIHTGEQPYKCDLCGAGFTYCSHLMMHTRTHTEEKLYTCDVCGVEFTHCNDLKKHKRKHRKMSYQCDVCDAEFSYCSSLSRHKRIHTGEKPYKCDVCGIEFTQPGNLKTHKSKHTEEKP